MNERQDYNVYRFSWKEWLRYIVEAGILCVGINYLFYKDFRAFGFMFPVFGWYIYEKKKQLTRRRKQRLQYQFREALSAIQVGISAGYSVENALCEARKDLEKIYGKTAEMTREFAYIEAQIKYSVPVEKLLYDLGFRSRVEDILSFSEILIQSKKTGGNMREILQKCIRSMEEQIDTKKEINALLASRKLEQKIMSVIPLGIILYMQFTSPELLNVLYGNAAGAAVMTLCLGLYFTAYEWGARLVDIEV